MLQDIGKITLSQLIFARDTWWKSLLGVRPFYFSALTRQCVNGFHDQTGVFLAV